MRRIVTAAGLLLLAVIGAVHYLYARGYYALVPYLGVLFYATVGGTVVVALGLLLGRRTWAWELGMLLAAGAFAGYVVSRTIGLPGLPVLPWEDPFGLAALGAEALFLVLGAAVLVTARPTSGRG
jgi:hypothetical protein